MPHQGKFGLIEVRQISWQNGKIYETFQGKFYKLSGEIRGISPPTRPAMQSYYLTVLITLLPFMNIDDGIIH